MSDQKTEKPTRIRRAKHSAENRFFLMSRQTAQDKDLSYDALGILSYLLSKPDDWVLQPSDLERKGCKKNKVYRILEELRLARYIEREWIRESGKVKGIEYIVHEEPFPQIQETEKQDTEKLDTEIGDNTDIQKGQDTESTETTSGASAPTVAHEGQSDGVREETVTDAGKSNGATLALDTIKAGHVVTLKNGKAVLVREVLPDGKFRVGKDLALDIITADDIAPVQNGAAKVDRLEQIPDKPAPVKKARKPDALFDAIALHIFDIPKGSDVDGGRVGKIKKWCVAHDVTAQDVQAFREWWDEAKGKGVSVPRGEHTFPENYLAYQAAKPGKSKLVVY